MIAKFAQTKNPVHVAIKISAMDGAAHARFSSDDAISSKGAPGFALGKGQPSVFPSAPVVSLSAISSLPTRSLTAAPVIGSSPLVKPGSISIGLRLKITSMA